MVIVNIEGGVAHEKYTVSAYSANGALLGEHHFNGTNTSIFLPSDSRNHHPENFRQWTEPSFQGCNEVAEGPLRL